MRYPNGQAYKFQIKTQKDVQDKIIYGNRGMTLEEEINQSNQYYLKEGVAVIHKKPIPIQIVKVDYPKRSAAVIKEAYFKKPSTTDYNGIYRGYYLDFEAKETKNKTSFPLSNFHKHQVEHMRACKKQLGICFIIVRFVLLDEIYLMPADMLFEFWDNQDKRKSIPKSKFESNCYRMDYGIRPVIPYLDYVDFLIKKLD